MFFSNPSLTANHRQLERLHLKFIRQRFYNGWLRACATKLQKNGRTLCHRVSQIDLQIVLVYLKPLQYRIWKHCIFMTAATYASTMYTLPFRDISTSLALRRLCCCVPRQFSFFEHPWRMERFLNKVATLWDPYKE